MDKHMIFKYYLNIIIFQFLYYIGFYSTLRKEIQDEISGRSYQWSKRNQQWCVLFDKEEIHMINIQREWAILWKFRDFREEIVDRQDIKFHYLLHFCWKNMENYNMLKSGTHC